MSSKWTTTIAMMMTALSLAACTAEASDGVDQNSEPKACPAIAIRCGIGAVLADSDGDGCIDSCKPIVPPQQ